MTIKNSRLAIISQKCVKFRNERTNSDILNVNPIMELNWLWSWSNKKLLKLWNWIFCSGTFGIEFIQLKKITHYCISVMNPWRDTNSVLWYQIPLTRVESVALFSSPIKIYYVITIIRTSGSWWRSNMYNLNPLVLLWNISHSLSVSSQINHQRDCVIFWIIQFPPTKFHLFRDNKFYFQILTCVWWVCLSI